MNTKFTKEQLAQWIEDIKEAAKDDNCFSMAWFKETKEEPFCIVAGWAECFADNSEVNDLFCCSKSEPRYCMCIKIAENKGPYAFIDYELMDMPTDPDTKEVDITEVMLEWDDPADYAAEFFTHEWERIMEANGKNI